MKLNEMHRLLQLNLLKEQFIEKVEIYRNEVVYVNIKKDDIYFALDINEKKEIFLVFRNDNSWENICQHFNCKINHKTKIFSNNQLLVDFLALSDKDNIVEIIRQIINQLLEHSSTEVYLLKSINSKLININQVTSNKYLNDIYLDMANSLKDKYLTLRDTLVMVKEQELSIARFGDGEIRCMVTTNGCGFQKHDWKLMQELREISRENTGLLVCYPSLLIEDKFWQNFWPIYWPKCKFYLQQNRIGDAMITRPEAFYFYGQEMVALWKSIWNDKKICFISGENSRFTANHPIFSNIENAEYILSKNKNAYQDIDQLLAKCLGKKHIDIFLIALGPTGTVLSARLHRQGRRALDIGHLNNSFDTVFLNKVTPEGIPY